MKCTTVAATLATLSALACSNAWADAARTLSVDDDMFSGMAQDEDYTGGIALTIADDLAAESPGVRQFLARVDRALGMSAATHAYELEFGAAAFTPKDITERAPILDDRPYASLVYASAGLIQSDHEGRSAITTLTVGALGLALIPNLQRRIHHITGSVHPEGWQHQISEGGEPTLRLAHERTWTGGVVDVPGGRMQWLYRAGAGVGFLTDVSGGVALRWGRFSDPNWDLHSSPTGLGDRAVVEHARPGDRFVYATLSARVPLYNAILQGQFRHSDFTVSSDERRYFVPSMSLGFVTSLSDDCELHYFIRAQRSDVRLTERSETAVYGGISLSW